MGISLVTRRRNEMRGGIQVFMILATWLFCNSPSHHFEVMSLEPKSIIAVGTFSLLLFLCYWCIPPHDFNVLPTCEGCSHYDKTTRKTSSPLFNFALFFKNEGVTQERSWKSVSLFYIVQKPLVSFSLSGVVKGTSDSGAIIVITKERRTKSQICMTICLFWSKWEFF